jgi:enamine deaminase RidA (YjgF/YER057c/UK114 family)
MATKTPVLTEKAPKPLPGIYSQAIIANGVVYCSGAVAMDAETGKLVDGDVKAHTVCSPLPPSLIKRESILVGFG